MKIFVKATDIKWDVDEVEDLDNLPNELEVELSLDFFIENSENKDILEMEISEYVSDEISNITGFCHAGFVIEGEN